MDLHRSSLKCGSIIRQWRKKRRYSQLALSVEAGLSSKHLSFIETGKSIPSKDMIFRINEYLEIPRLELNHALRCAGHPPLYHHISDDDQCLKPIHHAINRIIEQQMPYPAFVLDRHWNVVIANASMQKLLSDIGISHHTNIIEALTDSSFNKCFIKNYDEVLYLLAHRFKSETEYTPSDTKLNELENRLNYALETLDTQFIPENHIVLNTQFKINNREINLFSTITELGSVQDITIGCFKIELMFPSDAKTEDFFSMNH